MTADTHQTALSELDCTAGRTYTISALEKGKAMEQTLSTTAKPIKVPGPDHPIAIERNPARVIVSIAGRIVADTREAHIA